MFGAISPNRESSERAEEQKREKREVVIIPVPGNVFEMSSASKLLKPDSARPVHHNFTKPLCGIAARKTK